MSKKTYKCPHCANFKRNIVLEYTERFGWNSSEADVIKTELKCPKCERTFWLKTKKGK